MLNFKALRKTQNLTGQQMAERLNCSSSTISELENNPDKTSFRRLASYLKQLNYQPKFIPEEDDVEESVLSLLRPRVRIESPEETELYRRLNRHLGDKTNVFFGTNSERSNEVVRNALQEATMEYLKDLAHYSFYFEQTHITQTILTGMRKQAQQTRLLEPGYLTVEDYRSGKDHKFKDPDMAITFEQQHKQWVPDCGENGYEQSVEYAIADDVLNKTRDILQDTNLIPNKDYYTNGAGGSS